VDALGELDAQRTGEHDRQRLGFRPREARDVAAPVDAVPGRDDALGVSDDAAYAIHSDRLDDRASEPGRLTHTTFALPAQPRHL